MKRLILLLFIFTSVSLSFSQSGYRVKLIENVDPFPSDNKDNYSALWGYTAPDGREYAILGCYFGTAFIDITDSNNISMISFLPSPLGTGSDWREMKTYSHYAYIVSESSESRIQIVDLQYLPDSIRYIGQSNIPGHSTTHTISQEGHFLYLNGCNAGLTSGTAVVDLSNPEVPVLRGKWNDLIVHDSRIINDTIWTCNMGNGKVSIIDAVNKDSLRNIRNWINNPLPNSPHNIALTNNGNFAFVTNELGTAPGNLKVWDVSDLEDITLVNIFDPYPFISSIAHNVEIHNDFAFIAYYTAGIKILDISNPVTPAEIGWYDTYPEDNDNSFNGCWGVYFFPASGKIIASDRKRGLYVLRPDLNSPVPAKPAADFTVSNLEARKYEHQIFMDISDGVPSEWQWTVSGPGSYSSTEQNPFIYLNDTGVYNVKLKVTNTFGTDSVFKQNCFKVIDAPMSNFQTTDPPGPVFRVLTSPSDTGKIFFNWTRSTDNPEIYYKIYFKKIAAAPEDYILSGNNGRDSSFFISKSYLDSMALRFGLTSDSLRVFYKVTAYIREDSVISSNSVIMNIKRTTSGISSINEFIPSEYKLHNNFPNPFNPTTNILFDIPKQSNVKFTLYDLTGREVFKFFEKDLAPGSYSYSLNLGNMNSSVYFVRINAGEFSSAIRIVLIK